MIRKKPLKLNLGAGSNKIKGYVNVDIEPSCKPDLICNFANEPLPYKDSTVDEILLFHCIEHIRKIFHPPLIMEFWRVLKPEAALLISYPEFEQCFMNWKNNYQGQRNFWEATMFGRQAFPSDFHVCAMHTPDFERLLIQNGFTNVVASPEPRQPHNTVISCQKGKKPVGYEDVLKKDMDKTKFERVKL
jgi:hypothetical protein